MLSSTVHETAQFLWLIQDTVEIKINDFAQPCQRFQSFLPYTFNHGANTSSLQHALIQLCQTLNKFH